jgi:hypothetical protein
VNNLSLAAMSLTRFHGITLSGALDGSMAQYWSIHTLSMAWRGMAFGHFGSSNIRLPENDSIVQYRLEPSQSGLNGCTTGILVQYSPMKVPCI